MAQTGPYFRFNATPQQEKFEDQPIQDPSRQTLGGSNLGNSNDQVVKRACPWPLSQNRGSWERCLSLKRQELTQNLLPRTKHKNEAKATGDFSALEQMYLPTDGCPAQQETPERCPTSWKDKKNFFFCTIQKWHCFWILHKGVWPSSFWSIRKPEMGYIVTAWSLWPLAMAILARKCLFWWPAAVDSEPSNRKAKNLWTGVRSKREDCWPWHVVHILGKVFLGGLGHWKKSMRDLDSTSFSRLTVKGEGHMCPGQA